MFTKSFLAVVMSGALWVAGDAAHQKFDCCFPGSDCCYPARECCVSATKAKAGDCCARSSDCCNPASECCVLAKNKNVSQTTTHANAGLVYCTITGEVYEGCCCEMVNGRHRCLVTGAVSDECCCIPIE